MKKKRSLPYRKNLTRCLSFLVTVLIFVTFALPAYGEEPEKETDILEKENLGETYPDFGSLKEELLERNPLAVPGTPTIVAESVEDENYILVQKTFLNLPADLVPYDFQVILRSDEGDIFKLNRENIICQKADEKGNMVWQWKIRNVGIGTYTVNEAGEAVSGYSVTKSGEGTVKVKAADLAVLIPVHETTCSHKNWPVKVEGDKNVLFAATLTQGGVAVLSKSPLSASKRAAVSQAVLQMNGPWKKPVYFYSVEEQIQNGTGFELNGATITYNPGKEEVIIGETRNWQHVATLTYSVSKADCPEIELWNEYKRSTADVCVTKTVTGNMGDKRKDFSFALAVSENGEDAAFTMNGESYIGSVKFNLKDGESILLKDIPVGARLSVTEEDYRCDGYHTAYRLDHEEAVLGNAAILSEVAEEGHTITFLNRKDVLPDTGFWFDTYPYFIIIGFAFTSALMWAGFQRRYNKKRRRHIF